MTAADVPNPLPAPADPAFPARISNVVYAALALRWIETAGEQGRAAGSSDDGTSSDWHESSERTPEQVEADDIAWEQRLNEIRGAIGAFVAWERWAAAAPPATVLAADPPPAVSWVRELLEWNARRRAQQHQTTSVPAPEPK